MLGHARRQTGSIAMKAARKLVVQTGARAMSSTEMDEYDSMCFVGATADKVFVHFNPTETENTRHRASARRALLPPQLARCTYCGMWRPTCKRALIKAACFFEMCDVAPCRWHVPIFWE
jgi:hypothetical protein